MRSGLRALAAALLPLAAGAPARGAPDPCAGAKLAAVARAAPCLLALEGKEAKRGTAPDPDKAQRCRDGLARGFAKAEAKQACSTSGDAPAIQALLDAAVADADAALAIDLPNACQGAKLVAVGKLTACLVDLRADASRSGTSVAPARIQTCIDRQAVRFDKAERKPCSTRGDRALLAIGAEDFAENAAAQIAGSGPGPTPGPLTLDAWTYKQITDAHALTYGLDFADLDHDGRIDILSGHYWYKSPGGDLLGAWAQSPAFPNGIHAMLAVDVDGDARTDVIGQLNHGSEIYWLEATDAASTQWDVHRIGSLPASPHQEGMQGFRLAQLEPGGKPEVVFSSGEGIYYFRIPANPAAGDWPSVRVNANPSDEGFGIADIDGDGKLDVAAGTRDGLRAEWYENPGDGSADWTAHPLGSVSDFHAPDRFEVADLDGDHRIDVVGTEENGTAADAKTVWWQQPADPTAPDWTRRTIVTQGTTNSLDVADLDGDGDVDVVVAEHRGTKKVTIFENDGSAGFTPHVVDEGKESHLGVQLFDLDGDGDLDMVSIAYDAPQYVHLWRNDALPEP